MIKLLFVGDLNIYLLNENHLSHLGIQNLIATQQIKQIITELIRRDKNVLDV